MTPVDFDSFLLTYRGGVSVEEGHALCRYAQAAANAVIVEIGSFKGKSAVALAHGQSQGANAQAGVIYCVDPHLPFKGFYAGVFGPQDRRDFYSIMLETGFYERVCLVNLKSAVASKGWDQPIGLLFIDGDHRAEAVNLDVASWLPHLIAGGIVIFDDAVDPAAGPRGAIETLLRTDQYEWVEQIGKMVALRKTAAYRNEE